MTLAAATAEALDRLMAEPLPAGLYVVATPIGNLGDISLRALSVLARAQMVLCEDTRHSRKLLTHFGIRAETSPYHEHNAERERPRILARLKAGFSVALISDAGTPLVSDPGHKLVREARSAGLPVTSVPGPSALLAALTSAGLPSDRFFFEGFLPPRVAARRKRLAELAVIAATLVFYEAPQRLAASLADMAAMLGARDGAVARELTKRHEEVRIAPLDTLARHFADEEAKGEMVVVVGPPPAAQVSDDDIRAALAAVGEESLRDAARDVAAALAVPRSRVYRLGLAIKGGRR